MVNMGTTSEEWKPVDKLKFLYKENLNKEFNLPKRK